MIEGPHEPKSLKELLQPTVDFFARHDPGRNGERFLVPDASKPRDAPGNLQLTDLTVLLVGCVADTPFMPFFNESVGHSAKTACRRCFHRGTTAGDGTSTVRCVYVVNTLMVCDKTLSVHLGLHVHNLYDTGVS